MDTERTNERVNIAKEINRRIGSFQHGRRRTNAELRGDFGVGFLESNVGMVSVISAAEWTVPVGD
jgi:hypothetical protein